MPPQENQSTLHRFPLKTLVVLLVLLIVVGALAYGWYIVANVESSISSTSVPSTATSTAASFSPSVSSELESNGSNYESGNYAAALQQVQAFESSSTVSQTAKDEYEAYNFGTSYRASGKLSDLLANIDSMKTDVIQNLSLPLYVRTEGINDIATAYAWMGENPQVFNEIFKGSSYQNFLAPNDDPTLSVINMLQWSWSIEPSSMAGGWLAGLDMDYVLSNPNLSAPQKQSYISQAESYIQEADAAEVYDPSFQQRPEYAGYLFWEAFAYGGLAQEAGGSYEQQYKTKYQDFISYVQQQNTPYNNEWEPYADYLYAVFLVLNDNDTADAQTQLQNAVTFVKGDTDAAGDEFAAYVRNKETQEAQSGMSSLDFKAKELYAMANISPAFKAFMASLQ